MYQDTDGKVYIYFGCTNNGYKVAVKLDINNKFNPVGKPANVLKGNLLIHGWGEAGRL